MKKFRSSLAHFPWLMARPGGIRGAIEFNLLPKETLERFWDALRLGIRPGLCFITESRRVAWGRLLVVEKLKLLPKEAIESFWETLWLGIQPFLFF